MAQEMRQSPRRLSDSVYGYLVDGINSGRWRTGDKLPSEAELCLELNASRSTVRSAIERLNGLGLVQSFQGKGTFVSNAVPREHAEAMLHINGASRLDVFEFRKIIESQSAALAAMRATSADVKELEDCILGMAEGSTLREIADQDMRFHQLIARCSGNMIIQGMYEVMYPTYAEMFMTNVAHMHKHGVTQHRQILLAIQSRNMEEARRRMLEHIDDAMRAVCSDNQD